jgi:hypothetical protein
MAFWDKRYVYKIRVIIFYCKEKTKDKLNKY